MQITIVVSTDEGDLTLKRTFTVTRDERTEHIQAAATLLNVSMAVVEEIECKDITNTEEKSCGTCKHYRPDYYGNGLCTRTSIYREAEYFCGKWEQKE